MKVIVKAQELAPFLKEQASIVQINVHTTYFFIPYWFKDNNDGTFEAFSFDHLPQELVDAVQSDRDGINKVFKI